MQQQPKSTQRQRLIAILVLIVLAIIAVAVRYILFNYGVLYGEAAAKMASLAVAGFIVVAGYLPLRLLRSSHNQTTGGGAATESIVATVAAILGLAVTAYSVSELVAPNTPVAASASACAGVPVYGANYFAVTVQNGANPAVVQAASISRSTATQAGAPSDSTAIASARRNPISSLVPRTSVGS